MGFGHLWSPFFVVMHSLYDTTLSTLRCRVQLDDTMINVDIPILPGAVRKNS